MALQFTHDVLECRQEGFSKVQAFQHSAQHGKEGMGRGAGYRKEGNHAVNGELPYTSKYKSSH